METSAAAVLHVTAAVGGGADRYIRDAAAATSRRHFIWHAGDAIDVIENVAARTFVPLRNVAREGAAAAIEAWRGDEGIGLLHLHGVDEAVLARLAIADRSLPAIATLHDVGFMAPNAFERTSMPDPDPDWIARIGAALARVNAIVVPSSFIRRQAERAFPAKTLVDVAPGIAPPRLPERALAAPEAFSARAPRHVVAVVGAIGPHKGSELVGAIARELAASAIALLVIGYTNERLRRGWAGDCFVHGAYHDGELPSLFEAYGVDVVLFPNRLPESFSYTLSEAWAARIPVVVPDVGALGERVARHGGGWRLPAGFGAAEAVALLTRLFATDGDAERARVKSQIDPNDAERIPTLAAMTRALDTLYERFAVPPQGSSERVPADALAPLLAANLDGFAFRAELLNLAEDVDNARGAIAELQTTLERTREWASGVEAAAAEARAWTQKLERDIEALKHEIEIRDAVLGGLPHPLRAWLMRRALRARG